MTFEITREENRILRHMIGADEKPRNRGYRNYYACYESSDAFADLRRLEVHGCVTLGTISTGGMHYFHATEKGLEAADIEPRVIKRALAA